MTTWVFVTSAGAEVGQGHAARVATLARTAAERGDTIQVCIPTGLATPPALRAADVTITHAPFTEQALGRVIENSPKESVIFLDLPDSLMESLQWMSAYQPLRVAFRMFGPPAAGALEHISLTPEFAPPSVLRSEGTSLPRLVATGWDLIIVRDSLFAKGDDKAPSRPTVLVTMGGADPLELTEKACDDLIQGGFSERVVVVVGTSNPRRDDIRRRYSERFEVFMQGEIDFDAALKSASVAIINGGLTRYECLAAKTPFVAISIHETQYAITEKVTKLGFGENLGVHTHIPEGGVTKAVSRLLRDFGTNALHHTGAVQNIDPDAPAQLLDRCREWQRSLLT